MTPQSMVYVVAGILVAFMGYSMFRGMLPLWGFVLGGWIGFTLLPIFSPSQADVLLFQIGAFVVGGIIGMLIAQPLYYVIVFLSGASLGIIFGVMVGALFDMGGLASVRQMSGFLEMSFPPIPQTITQMFFMIVLGVLLGGAAIGFQRFMITAASSFIGSALIMTGLTVPIAQSASSAMGRGAIMMLGWLILGMIAMFVQFRLTGEV